MVEKEELKALRKEYYDPMSTNTKIKMLEAYSECLNTLLVKCARANCCMYKDEDKEELKNLCIKYKNMLTMISTELHAQRLEASASTASNSFDDMAGDLEELA